MKVDYTKFNNISFALLVWYIKEGKEDEAKVYKGIATWNPAIKSVEFRRSENEVPVLIFSDEQLNRIQIVNEDMKETLLNCEYGIPLTLADLPDEKAGNYNNIGLKW